MEYNITNDYDYIERAKNGDKEIMTSLVNNNIGLVYNISKRFTGRGAEWEDIVQIGTIGLIKAIKNFRAEYDVKLSTYSVPYILGEIKRFIRDDGKVKVSRNLKELSYKIYVIKKEYMEKRGKELTIEEISKELKISKEEIVLALDATSSNVVGSYSDVIYGDEEKGITIEETLPSNVNEEIETTNRIALQNAIAGLNDRDKKIIELRYFEEKTQTDVANMLGISQVQVSRIEKKILTNMREKVIS